RDVDIIRSIVLGNDLPYAIDRIDIVLCQRRAGACRGKRWDGDVVPAHPARDAITTKVQVELGRGPRETVQGRDRQPRGSEHDAPLQSLQSLSQCGAGRATGTDLDSALKPDHGCSLIDAGAQHERTDPFYKHALARTPKQMVSACKNRVVG